MGRLTLILGGARSGKSTFAERLASRHSTDVLYIATAQAMDEEMRVRIRSHREKRPPTWQTLEVSDGIGNAVKGRLSQADVVVLDCLTLLVANLLLKSSPNTDEPAITEATSLVETEISRLLDVIAQSQADWIVVSNEVGMGLVPPYPLGRIYRDLLGWANQRLAAVADEVYLMIAGIPLRLTKEDSDKT